MLYDVDIQSAVSEDAMLRAEIRDLNFMVGESMSAVEDLVDGMFLYMEAEGDNVFSKIAGTFTKVIKGIVDFVISMFSKLINFVGKPFGIKIKVKAKTSGGGGGGGGSSSSSADGGVPVTSNKDSTQTFGNGKYFDLSFVNTLDLPDLIGKYVDASRQAGSKTLTKNDGQEANWLKAVESSIKGKKVSVGSTFTSSDAEEAANNVLGLLRSVGGKLKQYTVYNFDTGRKTGTTKDINEVAKSDNTSYLSALGDDHIVKTFLSFGEVTVFEGTLESMKMKRMAQNIIAYAILGVNYLTMLQGALDNIADGTEVKLAYKNAQERAIIDTLKDETVKGTSPAVIINSVKAKLDGEKSIASIMKASSTSSDSPVAKLAKRLLGSSNDGLSKEDTEKLIAETFGMKVKKYGADDQLKLITAMTNLTPADFTPYYKSLPKGEVISKLKKQASDKGSVQKTGTGDKADKAKAKSGVEGIKTDINYFKDVLNNTMGAYKEMADISLAIESSQRQPKGLLALLAFDIYVRLLGSIRKSVADSYNNAPSEGDVKSQFKAVGDRIDKAYAEVLSSIKA